MSTRNSTPLPALLKMILFGTVVCVISLMFGSHLNIYLTAKMDDMKAELSLTPTTATTDDYTTPPNENEVASTDEVDMIRITEASTVVLVMSRRNNWERRQAIRSTWATGHDNVYFIVGQPCPYPPSVRLSSLTCELNHTKAESKDYAKYSLKLMKQQEIVKEEQRQYRDILLTNRPESYRSLPNKLKESLAWVCDNLSAKWILKADDDFFVRVSSISSYLEQTHDANKPLVIGHIMNQGSVHRNGKWAELEYEPELYPKFPLGSHGYAISRPIAEFVAAAKDDLFEYQGEDTSIGIWLDQSTPSIKANWDNSNLFDNKQNCLDRGLYVIGHDITPVMMKECYEKADEVVQIKPTVPSETESISPAEDGAPESTTWLPSRTTNSSTVVIVMSARKHVAKRMVIRETWAKGYDNVFFIVAEACPYHENQLAHQQKCIPKNGQTKITDTMKATNDMEEAELIKEQATYRDMIYAPTKESYHSLVFKLKYALQWVVTHINSANWIVKADDDIFVRVSSVDGYLRQLSPTNPTVVGHIIPNSPVWKQGKWADWYDKKRTYPPWPQGSCGYAVSRPVAEYIKQANSKLLEYQGEDTTLGIWIDEEPVLKKTIMHDSDHFTNNAQCEDDAYYVVGHDISADKMRKCFKIMKSIDGNMETRILKESDAVKENVTKNDNQTIDKTEDHSINLTKGQAKLDLGGSEPTAWIPAIITNASMVVLVQSSRANFALRTAIRETWASGHDCVYFVVSDGCPHPPNHRKDDLSCMSNGTNVIHDSMLKSNQAHEDSGYSEALATEQRKMLHEQQQHRDMIYVEKHESYHGLVRKLKEAYSWVVKNTKADWIVKVDDDTFVRVDSVLRSLHRFSPSNPTVIGRIIKDSPVLKSGMWADPNYSHETYPLWPQGSCGHAVSRPVAQWVSDHKETLDEYQGEDSSLGIWIDESQIKASVVWEHMNLFTNEGKCVDPNFLIIGHDLSPQDMRACYNAGDEVENRQVTNVSLTIDEDRKYDEQIILESLEALKKGYANVALWPTPRISKTKTVIVVMTARKNYSKRMAIRNHWANGHDNVYFVIGEACHVPPNHRSHILTCEKRGRDHTSFSMMGTKEQQNEARTAHLQSIEEEQQKLLEEQYKFRDLIYTFKQESYRGLVHKLKESYSWVTKNTNAQWIVKADDDMYVRVNSVSSLLEKFQSQKPTVLGHIIWSSPVHKTGKWADIDYNKQDTYPPWPQGSCGHVVNRNIAEYIAEKKDTLFEYQGEDTSLAIWLDEAGFKSDIVFQDSNAFINTGNCSDPDAVVIGHQLSTQNIRQCFRKYNEKR